jgi:flavin reductase (DIM6/NTAB) family NADH-FMN oxidoreductase RutF
MLIIDPKTTPPADLYQFIIGSVSPRPIAFVSTVDAEGLMNLAPYSFFNAFSASPPTLVFSAARRSGAHPKKDTLANIEQTMECTINMVSHAIVHQTALAGVDFPKGISEFERTGLTPIASELVKAPRVKESPVQMECVVRQIVELGEHSGAGCLIVCEVVRMYINKDVLDEAGLRIDPLKIDLMGRMGRNHYSRTSQGVYDIYLGRDPNVVGFNGLPKSIQNSTVFSGNDLGQMAALPALPSKEEIDFYKSSDPRIGEILSSQDDTLQLMHTYAKEIIARGDVLLGVKIALTSS